MYTRSFLAETAEKIFSRNARLEDVTVVFPNRRAIIHFRKCLGDLLQRPSFPPRLVTIEDFIGEFSTLKVADTLELIYRLYHVYNDVAKLSGDEPPVEGIDRFYFWGEMLLRDFDEVDKYQVDAIHLFKDLSHLKELDSTFDFLSEEQKEFLKSFWGNFDEHQSLNKKRFLHVWRRLPQVYTQYKEALKERGIAFDGMMHREVAQGLRQGAIPFAGDASQVHFAGFNALTACEEDIISYFVDRGASVHWDMDAYYVNNVVQEAGRFLRSYQQHPVLKKTFPQDVPSHPLLRRGAGNKTSIEVFGAAQPLGQAKLMAHVLKTAIEKGMRPEETLIVLPDEKLLLPVLHGIAGSVEKLNVTMGFPLSHTPMFNFIELLVDLQIAIRDDHFNHRQTLALLGHPYVVAADATSSNAKRKEILRHNWVHIPMGYLATEVELHRLIFKPAFTSRDADLGALIDYLQQVVLEVGRVKAVGDLDREYAFYFYTLFNRLREVFGTGDDHLTSDEPEASDKKRRVVRLKSFLRLFRQLIRTQKIPFAGEPLKGLQVMGVLETRNLDFKNVFVLSLNEGSFPALGASGSYIPYTIRKAYQLPTIEHQDSIYAYLFYRVLQRAERVSIFYNSETDVLGQGEMSRYLQQLMFESGLNITRKVLHNPIAPRGIHPIIVGKDAQVMEQLVRLNEGNSYFRGISPSALNTYLECRLKFYFRHIARIKEPDEVEEELDARVLGNFLHDVMERFYKDITERKRDSQIVAADLADYEKEIDRLIDEVFIEAYRLDPAKKVVYMGQRLVVKEIVKRFAHRIVEMDLDYAPFRIEGLEQQGLTFTVKLDRAPYSAVVGGKIDRVDRKGDALRIIDYKTGKDKLNFDSVAALFTRDGRRNKAAFQTLLYALLYKENFLNADTGETRIVPGLINRINLFDEGFAFGLRVGREQVTNADGLLPEFQERLKLVFEELYDPASTFDQTHDLENCQYCPYGQICYR